MTRATSSISASDPRKAPIARATARQVAIALAAVLIVLAALDQGYGALLDHAFGRSSFNPATQVLHADADTVIVGASGGKYALDPVLLGGKTYNIAENGQSGYYAVAALNALPAGSIRTVIFALDTGDIAYGLDGSNVKHLARFAPWAASDRVLRDWLAGPSLRKWLLSSGFFRFRGIGGAVLVQWLRPRWNPTGYEPLDHVMADRPVPVRRESPPLQPSASGIALLDAAAAAVKRHGARLILLIPPIFGDNRGTDPQNALLLDAMRRHFAGLKVCDLTTITDPALQSIYVTARLYGDGAHLNGAGAVAYSRAIAALIHSRCGWTLDAP